MILAMLAPMRLSIVIPTLNEERDLARSLPSALAAADEVWVSDGGSDDRTVAVARSLGARVVSGPPERGRQLNRGAGRTRGEVLLFLHADTLLPTAAGELVRRAIRGGAVGGGFRLRFDTDHPGMRFTGRCINLRTRLTRCPLGDQAQFVHRGVFDRLDGFRPWPILEDLDFGRRLKHEGPTALIAEPVSTSPRRYLSRGIVRTLTTNWLIFGLYFAGTSPHRLARLYRP